MTNEDNNKTEQTGKESIEENKGENTDSTRLIDNANSAAERLEAANKKQEELLNRQESIMHQQILGGRTNAGQIPEEAKPETNKEYAQRVEREMMDGKYD